MTGEKSVEVARTGDRNALLIDSGLALSAELSLPAVLQRIVDLATQITGARYGALGVLGADGTISRFVTTGIGDDDAARIGPPPTGRGILGTLIQHPTPVRIADMAADPRSSGFPPNHPEMHSFLGAPVAAHGRTFGNIYLTEKQGAPEFDAEDERGLVVLATQAGVAIENARLYEETRRRERWLEAVREVTNSILAEVDVVDVLALIGRRARELVGADTATIATPDEGTDSLVLQVADGANAERLRGLAFPTRGSIAGEVVRSGEPILLADASTDPRAHQPVVRVADMGPALFVPLSIRGQAFGTLSVSNLRGGRGFVDADVWLIETFAGQAAVALEYARTRDENKRLVVLEDRERIAKELHDGAIQSLFAVGMGLQGAAAMTEDEGMAQRIESAVGDVDRVIRDLRNYIFGLRPGILADRQLDQAIRDIANDFQEKTGITTAVDVDADVASELATRAADIVQLTREALSNISRHAEAETCRVSLRWRDDFAVLEIDDDGHGFDIATARADGNGLRNIRERAVSLGGEATIESAPSEGTTIRVTIPV